MSRLNLSVKLIFDDKSFPIKPSKPMSFNCLIMVSLSCSLCIILLYVLIKYCKAA